MKLAVTIAGVLLVGLSASACYDPNPPVEQKVCINSNTGETLDPSLCEPTQGNGSVDIEIEGDKHKTAPIQPVPPVRTLPKYTPPPKAPTVKANPPTPAKTVQPPVPKPTPAAPPAPAKPRR